MTKNSDKIERLRFTKRPRLNKCYCTVKGSTIIFTTSVNTSVRHFYSSLVFASKAHSLPKWSSLGTSPVYKYKTGDK